MVTNQSGDRPISSLLGRRWNLGIAQRFFGEVEQAVEHQRCLGGALSISRRSLVDLRSKLGEIAELFRTVSRQWPTGDPPIPEQSPTGRWLILKILHGGRPMIGGAPKYARCPAGRRPGTELIEGSPPSDLGQKSKPLGQRLPTDFGLTTQWPTDLPAGTGRRLLDSLWPSGFDFWPKSLDGERSIRSAAGPNSFSLGACRSKKQIWQKT